MDFECFLHSFSMGNACVLGCCFEAFRMNNWGCARIDYFCLESVDKATRTKSGSTPGKADLGSVLSHTSAGNNCPRASHAFVIVF